MPGPLRRTGSSGVTPGTASRPHHSTAGAPLRSTQFCARTTGQVARRHRTTAPVTSARDRTVAAALAGAFLAGDWTLNGLLTQGEAALGARPRWLRRLAREVLSFYRDPPADRPRELAALITTTDAFQSATATARRQARPLRVVRHLAAPARLAPRRWPVARIDTAADLAALLELTLEHLLWYADPTGMQRRNAAGALQLYRYRWLSRAGRTPRLLEIPKPRLRRAQRTVLDSIVGLVPAHGAAHGFVPGRSARTGASVHVGADVVIGLDLAGFFAAVSAGRTYGILRVVGYPEAVAHLLTGLCTIATPIGVLTAMPPGGEPANRYALRRALATPHLPQGAPTSPQLANLSAYRLDCRLAGYAAASQATYTRYADDLSFSGGPEVRRRADRFVAGARRIVEDEGFALNDGKTRIQHRSRRQSVTGIVVNDRQNVPRGDYERLRATLHNAAQTSAAAQNRDDHPDFRAHLLGRIAWVEALHPDRGGRLRADFDRIDWS